MIVNVLLSCAQLMCQKQSFQRKQFARLSPFIIGLWIIGMQLAAPHTHSSLPGACRTTLGDAWWERNVDTFVLCQFITQRGLAPGQLALTPHLFVFHKRVGMKSFPTDWNHEALLKEARDEDATRARIYTAVREAALRGEEWGEFCLHPDLPDEVKRKLLEEVMQHWPALYKFVCTPTYTGWAFGAFDDREIVGQYRVRTGRPKN